MKWGQLAAAIESFLMAPLKTTARVFLRFEFPCRTVGTFRPSGSFGTFLGFKTILRPKQSDSHCNKNRVFFLPHHSYVVAWSPNNKPESKQKTFQVALKMPQGTDAEKAARTEAMQNGLKVAIEVPFKLVKTINEVWPALLEIAQLGNINCKSDLQVQKNNYYFLTLTHSGLLTKNRVGGSIKRFPNGYLLAKLHQYLKVSLKQIEPTNGFVGDERQGKEEKRDRKSL